MNKYFDTIKALIVVNVAVAGITFLVPDMETKMFNLLALYFPANEHFNYWQFVTSMFMHGGLMHLVLNMYGLWAFGSPLQKIWGQNRFLAFYFVAGIGANLIYTGVNYYQFHQLYEKLMSAGISVDTIQAILKTGNYDTNVIKTITKEELTNFYQPVSFTSRGCFRRYLWYISSVCYGLSKCQACSYLFTSSHCREIFRTRINSHRFILWRYRLLNLW